MLDHVTGMIDELSSTHVVIVTGGVGFGITISPATYQQLLGKDQAKLFTVVQIIEREQSFRMYGFINRAERTMYRLLKAVKGVGGQTALNILATLQPNEIAAAIINENVTVFKAVKGVGPKTAKRVIIELKEAVLKSGLELETTLPAATSNLENDAILAMQSMGYNSSIAVRAVLAANKDSSPEDLESLVRSALKHV